jgi:hypothetical protein
LLDHEKLFFLLASLKVILLLCCKSAAKTGKHPTQRRDDTRACLREGTSLSRWAMGNANLGHQERFTRVSNASDELTERLKFRILNLLDSKIGGEKVCLIPIIHLEPREGTLDLSLRIQVHPSHTIWHDHLTNLGRWRLSAGLAAAKG